MFVKIEVPDGTVGLEIIAYLSASIIDNKTVSENKTYTKAQVQSMIVASEPCAWCNHEISIIDDDFGQYLHPNFIKNCFHCGRPLRKDVDN